MPNWNKVNNDNDNNNNDNVEVTEFAFCCVFHTLSSGFRNTPFSKNLGSDSLKLCYWIAESQHVGISFKIKRSRILSSQQKCAKTYYVVTLFCTNYR